MPLDRHAARLLALRAAASGEGPEDPPGTEARRAAMTDLARVTGDEAPETVAQRDFATPCGRVMRRYAPPGGSAAAMLYLHGGGWVAGDLETHAGVCGALAQAGGCSVFALDYRRAPEHPFPAAVEDAVAALSWLRREAGALGLDQERIGIAGDSAGANIAAGACLHARATGAPKAALQLLICPILDPLTDIGSRAAFAQGYFLDPARLAQDFRDYIGASAPNDPRVAPLGAADLAGSPPALLHAAEYDPFRDEALAYAARLQAQGVAAHATVYPGMIHYFYAMPRAIPAARSILEAIGREAGAALRAPEGLGPAAD